MSSIYLQEEAQEIRKTQEIRNIRNFWSGPIELRRLPIAGNSLNSGGSLSLGLGNGGGSLSLGLGRGLCNWGGSL